MTGLTEQTAPGPGRIRETFDALRASGSKAFIPFLTLGDPSAPQSIEMVKALARSGADLIEIGLPFTDPMADGPVIQRASERALRHRAGLAEFFAAVREIRMETDVPVILFSYFNPLFQYGIEALAADCAASGVDGVLITDLPPEEAGDVAAALRRHGRDMIFLISPTTTDERLAAIAGVATGFLYAISRTGITGTRASVASSARELTARARALTSLPIAVGFGVSKREHVAEVWNFADAAVVGSAIVETIERYASDPSLSEKVAEFAAQLLPPRPARGS